MAWSLRRFGSSVAEPTRQSNRSQRLETTDAGSHDSVHAAPAPTYSSEPRGLRRKSVRRHTTDPLQRRPSWSSRRPSERISERGSHAISECGSRASECSSAAAHPKTTGDASHNEALPPVQQRQPAQPLTRRGDWSGGDEVPSGAATLDGADSFSVGAVSFSLGAVHSFRVGAVGVASDDAVGCRRCGEAAAMERDQRVSVGLMRSELSVEIYTDVWFLVRFVHASFVDIFDRRHRRVHLSFTKPLSLSSFSLGGGSL